VRARSEEVARRDATGGVERTRSARATYEKRVREREIETETATEREKRKEREKQ
jgi:hypothetical protein